ncbi:MAG TPA: response regulator [Opitutaceae bacterium]|nr:response regulator [Opitutaceae bacterium]
MKILHLEDNREDAALVRELLVDEWPGCEINVVANCPDFVRELNQPGYEVILSDFNLGGFTGLEALQLTLEHAPRIPFIFLSGTIGEDRAIEAVRAGAHDYVLKDRMKRLVTAIQRALRENDEQRKRQDAEEAQRRFVAILENTPDFVGLAGLNGRVFYVNHAGLRMVGLSPTRDPGTLSIRDFHPPEVLPQLVDQHIATAVREGTWSGENLLLGRDGRRIPVSQVIIAHKAPDGSVEYLSTVMRDITAAKEAERLIREQANFLNKARDAIIVTDLAGKITFWNQGAERVFGWTAAEAVGRGRSELFGPTVGDDATTTAAEDDGRSELRLNNKLGQPLIVDNRVTVIRDAAGQPTSHLSICTDVTAKKQLEEQFLRAQRMESIGMLAAGIAHDLNNVLAPILMGAPILRDHVSDPGDIKMLTALEKSAERGAGLVRQILGFAHGVSGVAQVVQVKHILRDLSSVIRETFPKTIRFEEQLTPDLWTIRANPTHIHQILLNLCVNARDAMPQGGSLRLKAENCVLDELAALAIEGARPGAWLVLQVEDTGSGIPPSVLAHIWEPFFTTKEAGKGTGLGLSTVRGIVESHNGFITLKTEAGRGTTFRVYLPATEGSAEGPSSAHPFASRGNGELILIVDDEPNVRDITAAILARHGYRVLVAGDGTEAVAMFAPRSSEIQLVITDVNMPYLDGAAVANVVRRINPDVKILAISGMDSGRDSPSRSRAFANAFLLKPFKVEQLLETASKLLTTAPAQPPR